MSSLSCLRPWAGGLAFLFYSVVDLVVCFIVWDADVVCAFNIVLILSKLPDTMEEAVNLGKKKKVAIEKQGRINRGMEDEEAPQS